MRFPKEHLNNIAAELNEILFNSALPINELDIRQSNYDPNIAAWYGDYDIQIFSNFHHTDAQLYETIAHELIHFYQDILEIPMNHNGKFFRYYSEKYRKLAIWNISTKDFKGNFANMEH